MSARQTLANVRAATLRHAVVQKLYTASFCLIYLMHNIWSARTLFYYVTVPLAAVAFDYRVLRSIVRSPIFIVSAVFLVLITLTTLAVRYGFDAKNIRDHLLNTVRVLVFLIITAELVRKDDTFLRLFASFITPAAAIAAALNIALFYFFGELGMPFSERMGAIPGVSMYYNQNVTAAIYMIACLSGVALLAAQRLRRFETGVLVLSVLVLVVAVALTQSRGPMLALAAGLGVIVLLTSQRRLRLILVLGALAALAVLLFGSGDGERPLVWAYHLNMAMNNPWVGVGLSTEVTIGAGLMNSHNVILSAAVRGGVLAAATLLVLVATCLYWSWRAWRDRRALMPVAVMVGATVAACADYEIVATSFGWQWVLFWLPVGLCLSEQSRAAAAARS